MSESQIFDVHKVAIVVGLMFAFVGGLGFGVAMGKEGEPQVRKEIAADCADLGRFRNLGILYTCSAVPGESAKAGE